MKLFVNGYGSPMHGWDWFVCGEVRNTKKEAAQDLRELKQKLKQLDELQKQLTDARNALLREGMQRDELLAALERFMDSHEECTDFDGFTAQIVSMDDYHQAQEAIESVKGEQ